MIVCSRHTDKKNGNNSYSCGRKSRVFYRVHMKDTYGNEPKVKVFGFCDRCADGMDHPSNWTRGWKRPLTINHLSGQVYMLEPVSESEAKEDKLEKHTDKIKLELKKVIKRFDSIGRTEWPGIFQDALDEIEVEAVMKS